MSKRKKTFAARVCDDCYDLGKYFVAQGVSASELTETAIYTVSRIFAGWRRKHGTSGNFAADFKKFADILKN